MTDTQKEEKDNYKTRKFKGLMFDGRIDQTKVVEKVDVAGVIKHCQRVVSEEHYAVCDEQGDYLTHFTPDPKTATSPSARQIAVKLHDWAVENNCDDSVIAVAADSTNVNTGYKGGAIFFLEKLLGHKLIWIVCMLHTNELPLRHLFIELDGKTVSNSGFSGPIGKALAKVTSRPVVNTFLPVEGPPLVVLPPSVVNDLSSDQKYSYKMVQAIRTGVIPPDLANSEVGPSDHSRWLNTGNRTLRLYVTDHGFEGKDLVNLRLIVEFLVGVYYPMWFLIKLNTSWINGPMLVLKQLEFLRLQDKRVREITWKYVKSSAWNAHSEAVLQVLLLGPKEGREFAVKKILEIRRDSPDNGDRRPRSRRNPDTLNSEANSLEELFDWSKEVLHEPLLTCNLSEVEILALKEAPMEVPFFPVHGQSFERTVKMVTEAASQVAGWERRDGHIRVKMKHRKDMPELNQKGHYFCKGRCHAFFLLIGFFLESSTLGSITKKSYS